MRQYRLNYCPFRQHLKTLKRKVSSATPLQKKYFNSYRTYILQNKTIKMENKICLYAKFGFCKINKECQRKHFREELKDLANCKNIKHCSKRHPKNCKRFVAGQCIFGKGCEYKHQESIIDMETVKLNEKGKELETVVKENNKENVQLNDKYKELEKLLKENMKEKIKLNDKFKELDKVVKALVRKVLSLEEERTVIKAKQPEYLDSEVNDMCQSITQKR